MTRRGWIAVGALAALGSTCVLAGRSARAPLPVVEASVDADCPRMANFTSLTPGMSRAQVERAMGRSGEVRTESAIAGTTFVTLVFACDHSAVSVMLSNDAMVSKTQHGL